MIKDIMKDNLFLSQKALLASPEDKSVAIDLLDTLLAHQSSCVGMAANMIGVNKHIICVQDGDIQRIMFNAKIIKTWNKEYTCQEGCLCHEGMKEAKRYEKIKVQYQDLDFKMKIKTFTGYTAQIIQHELDHCEGILI